MVFADVHILCCVSWHLLIGASRRHVRYGARDLLVLMCASIAGSPVVVQLARNPRQFYWEDCSGSWHLILHMSDLVSGVSSRRVGGTMSACHA